MTFPKLLLFAIFTLFITKIDAQKFDLGKVSVKELQEKTCPSDTNAVAAILYTKARTFFIYEKEGFYINHEYEFRIKIYKKEGVNWSDWKVPYYTGYENINQDVVKFSDCVTYNLEKGEVAKTKLKGEGTFKNNLNKYWSEAAITMPNVKVGSVIEFKYTIRSENKVKFPVFNFQYAIPVNYAQYVTEIPEFYIYNPITSGFTQIKTDAKIGFGYQNYADAHNQGLHMSYKQINTVHTAENIPALKVENYVDNLDNYRSSIDYELQKTRFPEVPEVNFTQTWDDVAKAIFKEKDFAKQLSDHSYFDADLRTILKPAMSETEKIGTILKFVQNKMNWNKEFTYFFDKGAKKAYQDGTGNSAEINFILIAMLNAAGINANPVLTSTINHGIPVYPNRTIFNYIIADANVDGKHILLDAVNRYTSPGILPSYALNWTGRLIRSDGTSEEINLVPNIASKEIYNVMATVDANGKINGKCRAQKTDYNALKFRERYSNADQESYLEQLENQYGGLKINEYVVENKNTDLSKSVVETFNFVSDNESEIIGGKIFIDPLLFFTQVTNPFKQEKRTQPIYFGFPTQEKYNINLEIPAGYVVESIPKSITITTPENEALFSCKILTADNKIQISATSEMNASLISADFYDSLKEFSQKSIEKQNEKIVLKKI